MIQPRPAHTFAWTLQPWGRALHSPVLAKVATHLFTTRDLPLRGPGAAAGWAHLAASAGIRPGGLRRLKQVHGVGIVVLRTGASRGQTRMAATGTGLHSPHPGDDRRPHEGNDPRVTQVAAIDPPMTPMGGEEVSDACWPAGDIIMTDDPDIAVAVQVADCVPLLLADPATGAVAAVHCGWRGTAAGVAPTAVSAMRGHFGSRAVDLMAAIGPSIGACCYQVGSEVREAFRTEGFAEDDVRAWFHGDAAEKSRYRLDLPAVVIDQLRAAGVAAANIAACGLCTACHPSLFPSYRRDGAGTGRIAGIIRRGGR